MSKTKLREINEAAVAGIFREFPTLEYFGWTQYTPYFNDGDACTFSANTDYPFARFASPNLDDDDIEEIQDLDYSGHPVLHQKLTSFLNSLSKKFIQDEFGDHASVRVYRDGTAKVERYDHD